MDPTVEERLARLETRIEAMQKRPKDFWDKMATLAPLISGVVIGFIGIYATATYNARQLEAQTGQKEREITVARVQTVERFFPHLSSSDDKIREAALDAIAVLGDEQIALKLAARFGGKSGTSVLARLSKSLDPLVAKSASSELASQFARLKGAVGVVRSGTAQSTAFFVSSEGLLLIPSFVLQGEPTLELPTGGRNYKTRVLHRDDSLHLALLKVDLDRPVTSIESWNTDAKPGEQALVLAFARGSEWVSLSGRIVGVVGGGPPDEPSQRLTTDIDSQPGFAGAPVVDLAGRLIGMAESRDTSGKSLVIPASVIQKFLERNRLTSR